MIVSIIIPIYNVENEIERCLLSVIDQDYKEIELILVNDHSTDRSFEIAQQVIHKHDFSAQTKFIDLDVNSGPSIARNSGITIAEGHYLFFLDSDDAFATAEAISTLVKIAGEQQVSPEIVVGNRWIEKDMAVPSILEKNYSCNEDIYRGYLNSQFSVIPCAKLIRTDFLRKHNLYFKPGVYHEDDLWWFQVCRIAENICVVDQVICNFYKREGSITSSITERHARDWVTIVLEMYAEYQKQPDYYGSETILWIEYVRRKCIKRLFLFDGKTFLLCELKRLQQIKFPINSTDDKKIIKQNLIMRMPTILAMLYFKVRY